MKELLPLDNFFEGSEKLLEIWFGPSDKNYDLRMISNDDIIDVLNKVNCQIVSQMSNDEVDSYVLSESSLFISKRRIILKTCGTTYLLKAYKPIVELAKRIGFDSHQIFYSRRKFMIPEIQPELHQYFDREMNFLDAHLLKNGSAYTFGPLNDECWNLYVNDQKLCDSGDQTFEMIMSDLDPKKMLHFYASAKIKNGRDVTKSTGICDIYKQAMIDDYLFSPCGYSMNGLIEGDKYMTIHVTPEDGFSYASFETNYPEKDYCRLILKLIDIFGPNKFFFTLCSEEENEFAFEKHSKLRKNFDNYTRRNWQRSFVSDIDVTFAYFVRNPG